MNTLFIQSLINLSMEIEPEIPVNLNSKFGEDRLSSLPDQLIGEILACLPLDDAIRTCYLSKHWRYKWRTMPNLCFHYERFRIRSKSKETFSKYIHSKINWVISKHNGNIRKLKLYIDDRIETDVETYQELNTYFDRLVRSNIQVLEIQRFPNKDHFVPSSIFDFSMLTSLTLCNCIFRIPEMFKGFKYLTTLFFDDVKVSGESANVDIMIQLCPLLKYLDIYCINEFLVLNSLDAPELETLSIFGGELSLNPTRLPTFFKLTYLNVSNVTFTGESTIVSFIKLCPNIKRLNISYNKDYFQVIDDLCLPDLRSLYIYGCSLKLNICNFDKLANFAFIKCHIEFQNMINCFKSLIFLHFHEVTFLKNSYTMNCPLLEHVYIFDYSTTCMILRLHAPNLNTLTIGSINITWVEIPRNFNSRIISVITIIVIGFKTLEKESNFDHRVLLEAENLQLIHFTLEVMFILN